MLCEFVKDADDREICPACGIFKPDTNGLVFSRRCSPVDVFGAPRKWGCDPVSVTRIALPDRCHNACIFDDSGKMRLCWRSGWGGASLHIGDLSPSPVDVYGERLPLKTKASRYGQEDPRVVKLGGQRCIGFAGIAKRGEVTRISQLLAVMDDDCKKPLGIIQPKYEKAEQIEKNWGWFDYEWQPHCVYTVRPHRILKLVGDIAIPVAESPWRPRWTGGWLRGGASPVRVGGEYWAFFHGVLRNKGPKPAFRTYSCGLYTFEARPPFRPLRYMPEPLIWPPKHGRPKKLNSDVVFPCGAVLRGGRWLVSYGVHDSWIEIAEFRHSDLERKLVRA